MRLNRPTSDPLGVLTSTWPVVERARQVGIDLERVEAVAEQFATLTGGPQPFTDDLHLRDGGPRTAMFVFVLDALNFCFWSTSADPNDRWRVAWRDQTYDGYWALVAALRRATDEGWPLLSPSALAALSPDDVARILRPDDARGVPIPLLEARHRHLTELGRGLEPLGEEGAATLIRAAEGSAVRLVQEVVARFPSFDDVTSYDGLPVRLYKRAQILVADLHGSFAGDGLGAFHDLGQLTAFADYKVPQVLRRLGILTYAPELAERIARRELLPPGSAPEVEIRAATVWACEAIRQALERRGFAMQAMAIDWALWQVGQSLPAGSEPYHRTLTVFY